jgi:hypothetical protein
MEDDALWNALGDVNLPLEAIDASIVSIRGHQKPTHAAPDFGNRHVELHMLTFLIGWLVLHAFTGLVVCSGQGWLEQYIGFVFNVDVSLCNHESVLLLCLHLFVHLGVVS